ncbi:MAG: radical SAM protein [Spirochaetales bacterium]|nr:radical SAM protein [Spirochaetales bacterium]
MSTDKNLVFSQHNIFSQIKNSDDYYLINLLTGSADIVDQDNAGKIKKGQYPDKEDLRLKGYLIDPHDEKLLFINSYLEFTEKRDSSEVQVFFVPWYSCNFACSYCYQSEYNGEPKLLTKEIIDAFYHYLDTMMRGQKKYITLFGGEPLMNGKAHREMVNYFFKQAAERNLGVAIVTNGYNLSEYIEDLRKVPVREIQVTLDGIAEVHDKRRPLQNGGPTFDKVVQGIDDALEEGFPVNLRIVMDKENIGELKAVSDFAIEKGWTEHPGFKTQIGRNYELYSCQKNSSRLFERAELYGALYDLLLEHPDILKFHKPAFSVSRYLSENGELPEPLFDSCPGAKTEWAFDYTGQIYACTATVGKKGEELGTFYPQIKLDKEQIEEWKDRDVTTIEQCRTCNVRLACGGGCAAVAKNKFGTIMAPDCRPIEKLLDLGLSFYFENENTKEEL